jgi:RNA polymerase sigma-70 factor (ECF subfamily)
VHEHEAAEDLAAEVFLEAVRGIRRYRYRGTPLRAWLYRIAHNLTADEQRRRIRQGTVPEGAAPERGVPDFADGVAERGALLQALRQLTNDQQQVVILRFIEGLSLAETASVMRRPQGAVKSLQHRAMQRLRALLEGEVA